MSVQQVFAHPLQFVRTLKDLSRVHAQMVSTMSLETEQNVISATIPFTGTGSHRLVFLYFENDFFSLYKIDNCIDFSLIG